MVCVQDGLKGLKQRDGIGCGSGFIDGGYGVDWL